MRHRLSALRGWSDGCRSIRKATRWQPPSPVGCDRRHNGCRGTGTGYVELRQLECFIAVAEHLHFGHAAAECHITQSALSQQIKRLERSVGVRLFDRTSRRVELTAGGVALLVDARAILTCTEQAAAAARASMERPTGELVVGVAGFCPAAPILKATLLFSCARPGVELTLRRLPVATAHTQLDRAVIDVLLTFLPPQCGGYRSSPALADEQLLVAMRLGHPLTRHRTLVLEQLGPYVVTGLPKDSVDVGSALAGLAEEGMDTELLADAALGRSLTLLPSHAALDLGDDADVAFRPLVRPVGRLVALWSPKAGTTLPCAFARSCTEAFRTTPPLAATAADGP